MHKQIKNGLIFGLTASLTMMFIGITYAALNHVSSGDTLTAATFNEIMDAAVPTGAVMAFNGTSCPSGWTKADGSGDEKDTNGNYTTLNLENEFIRGASSTLAVGTVQQATHLGKYTGAGSQYADLNIWNDDPTQLGNLNTSYVGAVTNYNSGNYYPTYAFRPRNVALLFCVKN